jgi:hypothetical protein
MRRYTRPSQDIPNKDLKKTLAGISIWFKPFNLELHLKPLENLFKRPKQQRIIFFLTMILFMSVIACISANIWTGKRELSKQKIAEKIAMISE